MSVVKNKSTEKYRQFWEHVESVAGQAKEGELAMSNEQIISNRMQGVDCPACELGEPHGHMKPKQPQGDVIERMIDVYNATDGIMREIMTVVAKVCTDDRDAQWERAVEYVWNRPHYGLEYFLQEVRARILSAKPDAAVEAVRALIDEHFATWREDVSAKRRETVEKIVAAVDKARGRG